MTGATPTTRLGSSSTSRPGSTPARPRRPAAASCPATALPLSEWLEDWEPLHVRTLGSVDHGGSEYVVVDIQLGTEGDTMLYLAAQGSVTPEQARRYAAELLNAADMLDDLTAVQA